MILTQVRRPDFTPKLTNYFHKNFIAFAQHLISYLFSRDFRGFPLHRANVYYKLSNKRNNYSIDLLLTRLSTSHIKAVNALQSFVRKQPLTSHKISQRASILYKVSDACHLLHAKMFAENNITDLIPLLTLKKDICMPGTL